MGCALLFSNAAPSGTYGGILEVLDSGHVFTKNERLSLWLADGNSFGSWSHYFTIVYITDKSQQELAYLSEGYGFSIPPVDHPDFLEMATTGEMSRLFSEVEHYVGEL